MSHCPAVGSAAAAAWATATANESIENTPRSKFRRGIDGPRQYSPRGPARSMPWKTVEDVELATLGWVHWHNTARLHCYLGDVPPVEF